MDLLTIYIMQSFLKSGSITKMLWVDSKVGSIAKSNIEVMKVKATFMSILFVFCAHLDLFAFAVLFLLLISYSKIFKSINTLIGSYLASYRLMPLTRITTLIIFTLLKCFR